MTTAEEKFDRFAHDYFIFLALRYGLDTNCRIKVVPCNDKDWETIVPSKLLEPTKNNTQFQHISLAFWLSKGRLCAGDKRLALKAAGFTPEQAETFSNYDALLFVNFDRPVRMKSGEPYIWNLLLSHQVLHLVEILTDQRIINEPADEHYYEAPEALQHFNRFVAWIGGLDEAIDRYVPCR